jgi:hypothetical protein
MQKTEDTQKKMAQANYLLNRVFPQISNKEGLRDLIRDELITRDRDFREARRQQLQDRVGDADSIESLRKALSVLSTMNWKIQAGFQVRRHGCADNKGV